MDRGGSSRGGRGGQGQGNRDQQGQPRPTQQQGQGQPRGGQQPQGAWQSRPPQPQGGNAWQARGGPPSRPTQLAFENQGGQQRPVSPLPSPGPGGAWSRGRPGSRPATPTGSRPTTPVGHGPDHGHQRPQGAPSGQQRPRGPPPGQQGAPGLQTPTTPSQPANPWGNIAAAMQRMTVTGSQSQPAPTPSETATTIQTETVTTPPTARPQQERTGSSGGLLVTRPSNCAVKKGTSGDPVDLVTNYYKFSSAETFTLFRYRIDFAPAVDMIAVRKAAIKAWRASIKTPISHLYMGHEELYSTNKLQDTVFFFKDDKMKDVEIQVKIRFAGEVNRNEQPYITFYNIIVQDICRRLQLTKIRDNHFDINLTIDIPQYKLQLIPGFFQAIAKHEQSLLLCIDPIFKVVRQETALETINNIKNRGGDRRGGGNDADAIRNELIGKIVMTSYTKKTFRVDDIDFASTPLSTFIDKRSNEKVSFKQHVKKHGVEIRHDNQPMLVSKPTKWDIRRGRDQDKMLIPELCNITGLTDAMRADYNLMSTLNVHLQAPPNPRVQSITNFANRIHNNQEIRGLMNEWGLTLDTRMLALKGRQLKPNMAELLFKGGAKFMPNDKGDFTQAFRSTAMMSSVRLQNWAAIVPERDAQAFENIIRELKTVARPIDFEIANPVEKKVVRPMGARGREEYTRAIKDIMNKHGRQLQLIFVVLPGKQVDNYAAVKKSCYSEYGVPSQCMISKNVNHRSPKSICTKIAIQMNAKLGGEPWGLNIPISETMYVGFDVYHPGGAKGASIAAMAATTNKTCSKYYCSIEQHATKQEVSDNMYKQLEECLLNYCKTNGGFLPKRIIFYRDGVGEGQLNIVKDQELQVIKKGLKKLYDSQKLELPKFCFIVVTKRINTRFFVPMGRNFDNPKPGTIVDDVVTRPEAYDFFLVSQDTRQGTVSPTNYNILEDSLGLSPDRIQILTYKLCYGYYNWSGSLSVPAPCQYAHKLALLTGTAQLSGVQQQLKETLFYL